MAATEDKTDVVYELNGTLLEACSCGVLCPCWIGEDPDGGACDAFNAYHFDSGTIRGIDVSGLNFVRVVHIPGNVLTPASWKQVVFVDERASDDQRQAILDAYDGKLGGPLADLAGLIGETLGVERAAITHEVHDGKGKLTIGDVVHSEMHPYTGPDGTTTTLRDSLFSTVPGSPAYVAVADKHDVRLPQYGMEWSLGEPQRDPGRLPDPAHGMSATTTTTAATRVPPTVAGAIAVAWALAVGAEISGRGTALHHDALIEGRLPYALALVLFLVAWQAMIAAMMVPSTLAAAAAVRRGRDGSAAAARGHRRLPRRIRARVDRVRVARVRRRHDGPRDRRPHAMAAAPRVADRRRHAGAGRRVPVQRAEGPLPARCAATRARSCCAITNADFPGRFALGRRHGLFCLGCCWALMLLMFAAGVANLWWMAGLTALMVYEKTGAAGRRAVPVAGIALLACAALVLAHPHWLPALLGGSH